jgi:DNA invertase Pin-like site-specific DNA recombinase
MTVRTVIYARYSNDNQSKASIDDQIRICEKRVARERWMLQKIYRDAAPTGANTLRAVYRRCSRVPAMARLMWWWRSALDRLSRGQEDIAALFKRLRFAGIRIMTLAEGEVSELHVGLKGTTNALFLKDLADKMRRGPRGRAEAGKSAGGNSYGYWVAAGRFGKNGKPVTGAREIHAGEAAIIDRIFSDYAAGLLPKRIALQLNAACIRGPRGGLWSASTINGNRARGTGILNNELYIGRLEPSAAAKLSELIEQVIVEIESTAPDSKLAAPGLVLDQLRPVSRGCRRVYLDARRSRARWVALSPQSCASKNTSLWRPPDVIELLEVIGAHLASTHANSYLN